MSRLLSCVGLGLAIAVIPTDAFAAPRDRVPGEIVVLLPAPATDALDIALAPRGLTRARTLTPDGRAVLVRTAPGMATGPTAALARDLVARGVARAAAPNLVLPMMLTPNDPYLATQWHLGVTAAGIRAPAAWDLETGGPSIVIGIIDNGIDAGHPDVGSKIWVNPGEIPGNAIDDDGNGYVDDVTGWDFSTNDNDTNPVFAPDELTLDTGFHGTFIAGLAAAESNNSLGIAGVAWGCKVMPLKVADVEAEITLAAVTEAFAYAIDNGVSVLNISFGGTDPLLEPYFAALVGDAVAADIVVVAAAGNAGTDVTTWPAASDSVLAVAATNSANQRASFSNWGHYVDIAAPGASVWSSISRNYTRDATNDFFFSFVYGWDGVNPYMLNDGTSFSCPLVAGAAALVRSHYPGVPAPLVIQHLVNTADVVVYDNDIGGRLNIYNALLTTLDASLPSLAAAPRLGAVVPNPLRLAAGTGTAVSFALPRPATVELGVYDVRGRRVALAASGEYAAGTHRARWDGRDAAGQGVPAGLYFIAGRLDGVVRSARVTVLP